MIRKLGITGKSIMFTANSRQEEIDGQCVY